jgi:hypothetical protein
MIPHLLLPLLLAAPPGYTVVKEASGCQLMNGTKDANGLRPLRAECHWPEVTPERTHAALKAFADHDLYFSAVAESTLQRTEGTRSLVHQVHTAKGINDREVLLWMEAVPVDGDGIRYRWSMAKGESLELRKGNVATAHDEGYWEARPHPEGGVSVSYYLDYGPGGKVPGFVVRWFQVSGLVDIVTELHEYLAR